MFAEPITFASPRRRARRASIFSSAVCAVSAAALSSKPSVVFKKIACVVAYTAPSIASMESAIISIIFRFIDMLASLVASGVLRAFTDIKFPISLYYVVGFSTVVWLAVTFLTSPEKDDVLISFYRRVRPGGMLWRRISTKIPDVKGDCDFGVMFVNWVSGVVLVYTFLFGIGDLILAKYALASLMFVIGISCGFIIWHNLARYTAPAK